MSKLDTILTEESRNTGGPIAGLVVAVPLSLILWGIVMAVLWQVVK